MDQKEHMWFLLRGKVMIDLRKYRDIEKEVKIVFTDTTHLIGLIESVDSEEESGIGEVGMCIITKDGSAVVVGESEVKRIEVIG